VLDLGVVEPTVVGVVVVDGDAAPVATPGFVTTLGVDTEPVDVDALCDPPEAAALEELAAGVLAPPVLVEGLLVAAGIKRPVRFQKAENPLNGPPTIWLDHCRVYAPVVAL
jgi:hypothetical protein